MNKSCVRCKPKHHRLGIMQAERVDLPDGTVVEEYTALCRPCRRAADADNRAASRRRVSLRDLPLLEWLFTAPSAKEPIV